MSDKTKTEYISVGIPKPIIKRVDEMWREFGYRSRADMITDAVRLHIAACEGRWQDQMGGAHLGK